jgi:hypothetical protein
LGHLVRDAAGLGLKFGQRAAETFGVLLGEQDWYVKQLGRVDQVPCVGDHDRAVLDCGHKSGLKVHDKQNRTVAINGRHVSLPSQ